MSAPSYALRNRIGLLVTAFMVSLGLVAGATTAFTDSDDRKQALPKTGEPVPVIAPVATGPTPPAEPDPASEGGAASASPSEEVSEAAATESGDGGSGAAPAGDGGTGTDASSDESGTAVGEAGETLPDLGVRFYDECAGTEPGAEPPADCPEGGVGGTVLALTDPPPQTVFFAAHHVPGTGWATRCTSGPLGEGEQYGVVTAANPGTMTLEYWPSEGLGWSEPSDPSTIVTIERSTASDSDPEHELWNGWIEAGTLATDFDHRVQYCLTLSGLRRGGVYAYRVSSTDIFGSSDSRTGSFSTAETRGRPPVTITPVDDTRVSVQVPIRPRQTAIVHAVPSSGDDAATCAGVEAGGLADYRPPSGPRRPTESTVDLPDDVVAAEDYPWDPRYDRVYEKQLSLDEGTTSSVCVWWQTGPARSYDSSRIDEREEHLVTTPNRYRLRASIERLTFVRPVGVDDVELAISQPGGNRLCSVRVPAEEVTLGDVERVVVEPREVFCDLTGQGDTAAFGDALNVTVTGPFGPHLTYQIDISARPCGPDGPVRVCTTERTDWYRLNIPAERAVRRLCGGIGDVSCGFERDETVGTALLRVDLVDGPHEGGSNDYGFSPPVPFTGDDTVPEAPPYPRLDDFTSGLEAIPGDHDSLRVTANLDRIATVRASVGTPAGGSPPCLLDGATGTVTSPAPAISHSLTIDGLCAGHAYFVALEMTDGDGDVSYATVSGLDVPEPRQRWAGAQFVPAFTGTVDVDMQILALPGRFGYGYMNRATVTIDGHPLTWPETWRRHGCFTNPSQWASSPARFDDAVPWSFSNQVEIVVELEADEAFNWDDRDPLHPRCERGENSGRTRLQATLSYEELVRGPITLTSPTDDQLQVQVVITVRPTE